MSPIAWRVVALLVPIAILVALWHWARGLVMLAVIVFAMSGALALSGASISAAAWLVRLPRWLRLRRFEGRYYEYKGVGIEVVEDEAGERWLAVDDVRDVVPGLPPDDKLRLHMPCRTGIAGCRRLSVRADALDAALAPSSELLTQRFRQWLQRVVIAPSPAARQRRLERLGPGEGDWAGPDHRPRD